MRYDTDRKQSTRAKIVETAARVLRRDGIAASGVATLMAEAGLTNGAFYAHFASKEALVAESVVHALRETTAVMAATSQRAAPGHALDAIIDLYLQPLHVVHPERGCAIAALGPELARRPPATREAVNAAVDALLLTVADALPAPRRGSKEIARTIFTSMVGTIQLARTSAPALVPSILDAGAAAARLIGQLHPGVPHA